MVQTFKSIWHALVQAGRDFVDDDAMTMAGALSFYTALSLSPLIVLLLTAASFLGDGTQNQVVEQMHSLVGPQAAQGLNAIISSSKSRPNVTSFAGIVALIVLLFSASGVFAQLQASMNRIWAVTTSPTAGILAWIVKRLLTFVMILGIGVILVGSLAVSAATSFIFPHFGVLWRIVTFAVTLAIFIIVFALMYKLLPDLHIPWHYVWTGAIFTATLFAVGKLLIGQYLSHTSFSSSYGAAGSLIVLLVWVYYSSLAVFFGAEITQVYARGSGAHLRPSRHAVWAPNAPEFAKDRHAPPAPPDAPARPQRTPYPAATPRPHRAPHKP